MAQKDFHHPFQPYDIQQQFMEAMYECIDNKQVGIFESPTGTGKSLSLICASLTWLREHKRKTFDEALASVEIDDGDPDWIVEAARQERAREIRSMRAELDARLKAVRERENRVRKRQAKSEPFPKRQKRDQAAIEDHGEDEQFLLDDYESGDDVSTSNGVKHSAKNAHLMEKLGLLSSKDPGTVKTDTPEETKIIFCSRTHSQLTQFIGELKRVRLPPGVPRESSESLQESPIEELRHLTLGSRKNLCINPKVSRLPTQTAINERCIELQQAKASATNKCPHLPSKDNEDILLDFRDHALADICDIEDLASLGSRLQICPYYASRQAIAPAEIVTLPYPLLLQKSARDALGMSLKDHVVVIDEAHNLMSAVEGTYSAEISDSQLSRAKDGLIVYLQRFRNRLKGSNRTYVAQVVRVIDSLLVFAATARTEKLAGGPTSPSALLAGKAVDHINLFKLVRYIDESKLARKVEGYLAHSQSLQGPKPSSSDQVSVETRDVPTLTSVQNFLLTLMNPSREGQFFWSKEDGQVTMRYLLLDPSEHFRQVVQEARSVILAGGTMSPMEDYKQQLFPYISSIATFSCGHLIPASSLFVRTISADGNGRLEFSFKARTETNAIRLGNALEQIAKTVQGGLVMFFPSYSYLENLLSAWRKHGLMARLQTSKSLFLDSRTISAEETFKSYSETIQQHRKSAIMLSVIGGKLSEGINFSDDLGRCVIVVGLPFPNLETPAWKAKMKFLEEKARVRGESAGKASREHAENVCMRSVNQAIGRAIRHKNDWASILLFDSRYHDDRIQAKLPGWIKTSSDTSKSGRIDHVAKDLAAWFKNREQNT